MCKNAPWVEAIVLAEIALFRPAFDLPLKIYFYHPSSQSVFIAAMGKENDDCIIKKADAPQERQITASNRVCNLKVFKVLSVACFLFLFFQDICCPPDWLVQRCTEPRVRVDNIIFFVSEDHILSCISCIFEKLKHISLR